MKTLKLLVAAGALATGLAGIAGSAQAATTFTCDTTPGVCTFDGTTGTIAKFVARKTTESDIFEIALASAGTLTLTFTSAQVKFLEASFNGSPFTIVKKADNVFKVAAAGTYDLMLKVQNPSAVQSSFSGTIDFAAVPEPATWGMMLGGVALAGGALRRRRAPKAKTALA